MGRKGFQSGVFASDRGILQTDCIQRDVGFAFKLIQAPEPKIDWQEPEPPEGGSALKYTKEHEESEEDDGLSTKHPSLESDFRHLLDLCWALRLAEKGDLAQGIKPNAEDALRLWAALYCFIAKHGRDNIGSQYE